MSNTNKYVSKAGQSVSYGVNGDGNPEYLRVNKQFGGLMIVDPMIQSTIVGTHFYINATTSLGDTDDPKTYLIETPDSEVWAHMKFGMDGSMITEFAIYEDSGYSATTDKYITGLNANRNSTDSATLVISEDPSTDATVGDLVAIYSGGGAAAKSTFPEGIGTEAYRVLKQDTTYLVVIDSGSDSNLLNVYFDWFEVQYSS